jgi:hypothetical protein
MKTTGALEAIPALPQVLLRFHPASQGTLRNGKHPAGRIWLNETKPAGKVGVRDVEVEVEVCQPVRAKANSSWREPWEEAEINEPRRKSHSGFASLDPNRLLPPGLTVRMALFDWRALRQFPHFCVAHSESCALVEKTREYGNARDSRAPRVEQGGRDG